MKQLLNSTMELVREHIPMLSLSVAMFWLEYCTLWCPGQHLAPA